MANGRNGPPEISFCSPLYAQLRIVGSDNEDAVGFEGLNLLNIREKWRFGVCVCVCF